MIDHIVGKPNPSWKRTQVFFVLVFWICMMVYGGVLPPRLFWLQSINAILARFSPWQIVVSTLIIMYAARNSDKLLGLGGPEPLARLYSPSYYRATWISTGLDAGFATAMPIRPKWLRDICSMLFSVYYILYANEADEKLRKYRAVPTVEMLRTTWEKTSNPYIQFATILAKVSVRRKILLSRPSSSMYRRPMTAYLYFAPDESLLSQATDLILDLPGGGFIAMNPEHHEERLRMWAVKTGKPVLALDYGKAPEYPYPFAIDEIFDVYQVIAESVGEIIGMSGKKLNIIVSGDSAGANLAVCLTMKLLETQGHSLQLPSAVILNYAALDMNFSSWMNPDHMHLLQYEGSSSYLPGLVEQRDQYNHISPLSMADDEKPLQKSWTDTLRSLVFPATKVTEKSSLLRSRRPVSSIGRTRTRSQGISKPTPAKTVPGGVGDTLYSETDYESTKEEDRHKYTRVRFEDQSLETQQERSSQSIPESSVGTRLTMSSRTGYFQDRIITPSMMRAMAIMYIGPLRNPDFATDYHISPVLAPSELLAKFPPLLMQCGEKDPFVDDTIIFAGRVREAKRQRLAELNSQLSVTKDNLDGEKLAALRRERQKLGKETEEDWVEMCIFSDWSHGYLQMPSLMTEAKEAINDLADWIDEHFATLSGSQSSQNVGAQGIMTAPPFFLDSPDLSSDDESDEHIIMSSRRRASSGTTNSSSGESLPWVPSAGDQTPPLISSRKSSFGNADGKNGRGQTITESEVMRRRRFLDSHVFSLSEKLK